MQIGVGDWEWGLRLRLVVGDWDWVLGIRDWGLVLRLRIGNWGLGLGNGIGDLGFDIRFGLKILIGNWD